MCLFILLNEYKDTQDVILSGFISVRQELTLVTQCCGLNAHWIICSYV